MATGKVREVERLAEGCSESRGLRSKHRVSVFCSSPQGAYSLLGEATTHQNNTLTDERDKKYFISSGDGQIRFSSENHTVSLFCRLL